MLFGHLVLGDCPMSAHLILLRQSDLAPIRVFALTKGRFVLGRSSNCDFVVYDSTVSRRHAEVAVTDGSVTIRDLGSQNGTYVDDEIASEETPICHGQRVRLGDVSLVLAARHGQDGEVGSELETEPLKGKTQVGGARLSPAQQRVFDQLLEGKADKQIAKKLSISSKTVHQHVHAIFRAFGVHSRTELLATFVPRSGDSITAFGVAVPSSKGQAHSQ
jgi:DNA-binding CsgD family transcriptional regulator